MINRSLFLVLFFVLAQPLAAQQDMQIALLKYNGGGDWYANPTSLGNLVRFCNEQLGTQISNEVATVEPLDVALINYPFVHMTGHGNVLFSPQEAENLRAYLLGGGFLHIDDNYGLDPYVRTQMKKVFPELDFVELPTSHPVFSQRFNFPNGIPKIHEHDGKPAQAFGLFYEGRMVCFYTYECDLGDGWEDAGVHHDSEETRSKALRMGANLIEFVFTQSTQISR